MKKIIQKSLKKLIKDRKLLFLVLLVFLSGVIFSVFMAGKVEIFDRLIHVKYTAFGLEHYQKDSWTYRVVLAVFGILLSVFHSLIIAKVNKVAGRRYAVFFAFMSLIVVIFGIIILGNSIREIPN